MRFEGDQASCIAYVRARHHVRMIRVEATRSCIRDRFVRGRTRLEDPIGQLKLIHLDGKEPDIPGRRPDRLDEARAASASDGKALGSGDAAPVRRRLCCNVS